MGKHTPEPDFTHFFAGDLFTEIDKYIAKPKNTYRVVSVGMHPSIAQFNGFYTLDGYLSNYPLSYKLHFRQIIWRELNKSEPLRQYFDGWGNRCYVFSSELGEDALFGGRDNRVLHNLQIDTGLLRAMGGDYVISAAQINNSEQLGLRFERKFSSPDSFWHIYLYYVVPPVSAGFASVHQTGDTDIGAQTRESAEIAARNRKAQQEDQ